MSGEGIAVGLSSQKTVDDFQDTSSIVLELVTPLCDAAHAQLCSLWCLLRVQITGLGSRKIKRKGVNSLEDFKDPAVSYSFDITKNDHEPVFCDYGAVIIF